MRSAGIMPMPRRARSLRSDRSESYRSGRSDGRQSHHYEAESVRSGRSDGRSARRGGRFQSERSQVSSEELAPPRSALKRKDDSTTGTAAPEPEKQKQKQPSAWSTFHR